MKEFCQPGPAAVGGVFGDFQETIVCEFEEIIFVHGIKCENLFFKISGYIGGGGILREFRVFFRPGEHYGVLLLPEFAFVVVIILEAHYRAEFKRFTSGCVAKAFEFCGENPGGFGVHIVTLQGYIQDAL